MNETEADRSVKDPTSARMLIDPGFTNDWRAKA
jgi:hypothetical protein